MPLFSSVLMQVLMKRFERTFTPPMVMKSGLAWFTPLILTSQEIIQAFLLFLFSIFHVLKRNLFLTKSGGYIWIKLYSYTDLFAEYTCTYVIDPIYCSKFSFSKLTTISSIFKNEAGQRKITVDQFVYPLFERSFRRSSVCKCLTRSTISF